MGKFLKHVFGIVDFLGVKPHAIKIHSGRFQQKRNNIEVLSKVIKLYNESKSRYDRKVLIFIENSGGVYPRWGRYK